MKEFALIEEAIEDIKAGKMVVVVDDEDRENEGDLIMAAEKVTPEAINFMVKYARGLVCAPLTKTRARVLELNLMVKENDSVHHTAFTVSIDAAKGGTGISAADRALTLQELVNPQTKPSDLLRPGHIFPLIARDGGVLERTGHTEASVDLCKLAGLAPVGVICEIMAEDGSMLRGDGLDEFCRTFNLKKITIESLVNYRKKKTSEKLKSEQIKLPTKFGEFDLHLFEKGLEHHVAISKEFKGIPLVRMHSECFTGDIFGSARCDCGEQLHGALECLNSEGGVILYLRQEGRGIGLPNKIRAYALQDQGFDTVEANHQLGFEADLRRYDIAAQMLMELGISRVRLLTNNPIKISELEKHGIEVVERVPLSFEPNDHNKKYLFTKKTKMNHFLGDHLH